MARGRTDPRTTSKSFARAAEKPSLSSAPLPPPRGRHSPNTSATSSEKCVSRITNFGHCQKSVERVFSKLANSAPAFSMRRGGGKRGKGGEGFGKSRGKRERKRGLCQEQERQTLLLLPPPPPPPPLSQSIDSSPVLPPPPFLLLPPFSSFPKGWRRRRKLNAGQKNQRRRKNMPGKKGSL